MRTTNAHPASLFARGSVVTRCSTIIEPISQRLLSLICSREVVLADETRLPMQNVPKGKSKIGFVWTFGARDEHGGVDIAYHFANSRSGATPKNLLEGTSGVLLVDGYSGYNDIEKVSSRRRAARFAHVRRYFFESLNTAPIAQRALDLTTALYRVEHEANEAGFDETSHLEFRRLRAGPLREQLKIWLDEQLGRQPPKSPLGKAIRYTLGQWDQLGVFLADVRVPLDNNASERALRRIAWQKRIAFSSATSQPTGASPGSTRSWPRARRAASTPSITWSTCCRACKNTRLRGSTTLARRLGCRALRSAQRAEVSPNFGPVCSGLRWPDGYPTSVDAPDFGTKPGHCTRWRPGQTRR